MDNTLVTICRFYHLIAIWPRRFAWLHVSSSAATWRTRPSQVYGVYSEICVYRSQGIPLNKVRDLFNKDCDHSLDIHTQGGIVAGILQRQAAAVLLILDVAETKVSCVARLHPQ